MCDADKMTSDCQEICSKILTPEVLEKAQHAATNEEDSITPFKAQSSGRAGRNWKASSCPHFTYIETRAREVELLAPGHTASGRIAIRIHASTQNPQPFHTKISWMA